MYHLNSNTCANGISHHQCSAFQRIVRRPSVKRSQKKVSFNETVRIVQIPERSSDMTGDEKSQMYYSKKDLISFQVEGREVCKKAVSQAVTLAKKKPALSPGKSLSLVLKHDSTLRGFEAMLCPSRKGNKKMVLKAVHTYYTNLQKESQLSLQQREEILAGMYSQLSYWSQMLAVLTAQTDTNQAYQQDTEIGTGLVQTTPALATTSDKHVSLPNVVSPAPKPKRRGAFVLTEQRRKRRRVTKDAQSL